MPSKDKIQKIISSQLFRYSLTALSIVFVVLSYFITITPDGFLRFGYFGIFVFNAISSGLLLMPVLTERFNLILLTFFSASGNILNTSINYFLGMSSSNLFAKVPVITKLKELIKRFGLIAVYVLAVIPMPVDINGLLSGYLGIPFTHYILVNFLGKMTLFFLAGIGVISLSQAMKR